MIDQGDATLVFATRFGYFNPHVKEVAPKYPKITFLHAGGHAQGRRPDERRHLLRLHRRAGIPVRHGGRHRRPRRNKLGYIAAKPITPVLRDINAFELGAKSVNPNAR